MAQQRSSPTDQFHHSFRSPQLKCAATHQGKLSNVYLVSPSSTCSSACASQKLKVPSSVHFKDSNDVGFSGCPTSHADPLFPSTRKDPSADDLSDTRKSATRFVVDEGRGKSCEAGDRGKILLRFRLGNGANTDDGSAVVNAAKVRQSGRNLRPKKAMNWGHIISDSTSLDASKIPPSPNNLPTAQVIDPDTGKGAKPAAKKKSDERDRGFSVSLSKEEIEADFFAMTGSKPPRRPKRRPRSVQREMDCLFPGLSLTSITPESCRGRYATRKQ